MKDFKNLRKTGYTIVPNGILRIGNISAKAMGVYYIIVSMPDEWNFTVSGLCSVCSDGRDSILSAIRELENAGFLKRTKAKSDDGRFTNSMWRIYDSPQTEKPSSDSPSEEVPPEESTSLINTEPSITNPINTDPSKDSSDELFVVPGAKQRITDAWNRAGLTQIKEIRAGSARHKMFCARLREYGEEQILEAVEKAKNSPFLKGQNAKGWIITFDWFLKPNNFIKVLEGNYDERNNSRKADENRNDKQADKREEKQTYSAQPFFNYPDRRPSYDIEAFKRDSFTNGII